MAQQVMSGSHASVTAYMNTAIESTQVCIFFCLCIRFVLHHSPSPSYLQKRLREVEQENQRLLSLMETGRKENEVATDHLIGRLQDVVATTKTWEELKVFPRAQPASVTTLILPFARPKICDWRMKLVDSCRTCMRSDKKTMKSRMQWKCTGTQEYMRYHNKKCFLQWHGRSNGDRAFWRGVSVSLKMRIHAYNSHPGYLGDDFLAHTYTPQNNHIVFLMKKIVP